MGRVAEADRRRPGTLRYRALVLTAQRRIIACSLSSNKASPSLTGTVNPTRPHGREGDMRDETFDLGLGTLVAIDGGVRLE